MRLPTAMARIAYFYREMSEYIEIDLRLLRERHEVEVTECASRWPHPRSTWRSVANADVVMSWFASWHALLPALLARVQRKPFLVVVGGYDTACLPGIAYGHQRGGVKALVARAVLSLATHRVGISEFTMQELAAMGFGGAADPLVPLGLDPLRYACMRPRQADLVVTVGGVYESNLTRKGLEPFVRAAAECPDLKFVLIGDWVDGAIERLRAIAPANVQFTGRLSHADKVAWLERAAVIVQASQHEAFGLSLAEGMLCGAVPVVTRAGALPWVAGGTGVVVPSQDAGALAAGIRAALALGPRAGQAARARVLAEFTVQRRAERLEQLLASCGIGPESGRDEACIPQRHVA
jgi:glycosyltransferase involved in cell wall biosynthesis